MKRLIISLWSVACLISSPHAMAEAPTPSGRDARVLFVDYHPEAVTRVEVRRGYVSRVILEEGERILTAATGLTADCTVETSQWCVRADEGSNTIWIKPKAGAIKNNLELKTDRRDYSLEFEVVTAKPIRNRKGKVIRWTSPDPMYRVIYRYPVKISPASESLAKASQQRPSQKLPSKPEPRNWAYSMEIAPKSESIAPSLTFDDGRFTYFRFAANRDVPTLYRITPAGEEERLNFHMEGDLVVVQRTAERFVLRLGAASVGIWNDAFDPDGIPPSDGTTVKGLHRDVKEGNDDTRQ
ncbi:TrbG/VirB9 family P-type conjugative transfer protein [Asticcacaulis sp. W401b]|uniref:TrbG/VirB9 family P-type conjugative transfer protein n=1 Tax=Asticcacaulis sp. W401b TaxID=3388666 RepID=UPI003970B07C